MIFRIRFLLLSKLNETTSKLHQMYSWKYFRIYATISDFHVWMTKNPALNRLRINSNGCNDFWHILHFKEGRNFWHTIPVFYYFNIAFWNGRIQILLGNWKSFQSYWLMFVFPSTYRQDGPLMQSNQKCSIYQRTLGERKQILKENEKVNGIFGIGTL